MNDEPFGRDDANQRAIGDPSTSSRLSAVPFDQARVLGHRSSVTLIEAAPCTKLMRASILEHFPCAARVLSGKRLAHSSASALDFVVWSYETFVLNPYDLTNEIGKLRKQLMSLDIDSGRQAHAMDLVRGPDEGPVESPETLRIAKELGLPLSDVQGWVAVRLGMPHAQLENWSVWSTAMRQLLIGIPPEELMKAMQGG